MGDVSTNRRSEGEVYICGLWHCSGVPWVGTRPDEGDGVLGDESARGAHDTLRLPREMPLAILWHGESVWYLDRTADEHTVRIHRTRRSCSH